MRNLGLGAPKLMDNQTLKVRELGADLYVPACKETRGKVLKNFDMQTP